MKEVKIKWKKGNSKEIFEFPGIVCDDCGGSMRQIGSTGCIHEDYSTYFYQCITCKLVETTNRNLCYTDMTRFGWTREF